MSTELLKASAVELARRIRAGEVSPSEVLEAHIARIEAVNPRLNAVVQKVYDQARADVRAAEAQLAQAGGAAATKGKGKGRAELPPFLGVPCTIKEHFAFAGLPQTGGLYRRRTAVAREDAVLVKRMRAAGFIPMGTTNVPEALMWYESYNKVYGRTSNAYSPDHTPGGSSGGEGAIVGAGASPIGLGGDIGGSIRLPAFFNGIVGHKATGGRVPETGAWPGARGLIGRYKVCGPMGRRIEDLQAVMPLLAGPDGTDPTVDGPEWGTAPEYRPEDVTVYWFDDNGVVKPSPEIAGTLRATAQALEDMGFTVRRWRPPHTEKAFQIWANTLEHAGGNTFLESLGDFGEVRLLSQWLRWPLRRSEHIFPSLALATLERSLSRFKGWGNRMADLRLVMREAIESQLGPRGVLMCPVFHRPAPRHGVESVRHFLGFTYSGLINTMELPATAVPTGFAPSGLPVGVQVVGRRNDDHLTLWVAARIEEAFGGWRPPRDIDSTDAQQRSAA